MRVLVTGGRGFVGPHTVDALLPSGYNVRLFDDLDPRVHGTSGAPPSYLSPAAGVAAICASRTLNGNVPMVYDDGRQNRDFSHLSDIAQARVAVEDGIRHLTAWLASQSAHDGAKGERSELDRGGLLR